MKKILSILILLTGCLGPVATPSPKPVPKPLPVPTPSASSLTVTMDGTLLENLHRYAGSSNTVTFKESLTVNQSGMSITVPAGGSFSYVLTDIGGTFAFNDPKPSITVTEWGLRFSPILDRIILTPPNKGTAEVLEHGVRIKRNFVLDFEKPSTATETAPISPPIHKDGVIPAPLPEAELEHPREFSNLPELWVFGDFSDNSSCLPCRKASKALSEAKELPFRVVKNPVGKERPDDTATPFFMWAKSGKVPTGIRSRDWSLEGWYGLDHLIKEFNRTRKQITKTRIARCSIGFANEWVESRLGYTTVNHLVHDHGISYDSLKPYLNNQRALNQIHGWCHLRELRM